MSGDILVLGRPAECSDEGVVASGRGSANPDRRSCPADVLGGQASSCGVQAGSEVEGALGSGSGLAATGKRTQSVWRQWSADYLELTKPRIVVMILIVTSLSAVYAAGLGLEWLPLIHLLLGTALVAASAGVLNQVMEQRVDGRMARTRRRPLPDGRVSRVWASLFAAVLIGVGTSYLAIFVGVVPACLGVATWGLYVGLYTPLKTRTSFNTTIGAIAGALPMQMGYTAAGGSLTDWEGWLLFAVLFLWQYPHFMAIAWMYREDYGSAGLKMSPVVEPTGRSAGLQSVLGTIALTGVLVALVHPWDNGAWSGWGVVFAGLAILVTVKFVVASIAFAKQPDDKTARRLLRASLAQLPAAMLVLVISALV